MSFQLFEISQREISQHEQLLKDQQLVSSAKLIVGIGKGSFGRVYRAITDSGNYVAVKIVPFCYSIKLKALDKSKFEEMQSEAMNEVNIHNILHHENIIQILGVYSRENYIVMHLEYFGGEPLWPVLVRNSFSLDKKHAQKIVGQLSSAIEYLHAMKIAHGDLHIGNVLVNYNHDVKLIDFGKAVIGENSNEAKKRDMVDLKGIQDMVLLSSKNPENVKQWFLKQWWKWNV